MKIARLLPNDAKDLKEVRLVKNGKEVIDLSYQKISLLSNYDLIFSPNLLEGELSLLSLLSPIIVKDGSIYKPRIKKPLKLELKGRSLLIGSPLVEGLVTVNGIENVIRVDEEVKGIYPLPFRDEAFDNTVISEIMDYDVVREAYRVTKFGGRGYIIVPFTVDPVEALKVLSIKYRITNAKALNHYWIIEGVKTQSKRV